MEDHYKKDILTIIEFAHEINVHPSTVRRMIKSGRISAFKLSKGSHSPYRIARTEIQRLCMFDLEDYIEERVKDRLKEISEGKENGV